MNDEIKDAIIWLEEVSEAVGESRSCEDPPEMLAQIMATQSMARDQVVALLDTEPEL